jgi:hypothetical protein
MRRLIVSLILVALMIPAGQPAAAPTPRRVNIPYFASQVVWSQSAIFWFGQNKQGMPSQNYADVRMAYTADALEVFVTVVDYYLWSKEDPSAADDLTQYDGVAIYLDTRNDRAATPQSDDYMFFVGAHHWPNDNATEYHRQARGIGSGWNTAWTGSWTDYEAMSWSCNPGPNSNSCGIDYGWVAIFTIPWSTLELAGLPPTGAMWGLGVQLYDRDDNPPAGYVAPEYWPETFGANNPGTWGELHFGYANYQPPHAVPEGTTVIRAATPVDNTVEDAWMGGGGTCSSGHEGGTEINHGNDTDLFVGSETAPTHFPCYNKSYLRFALSSIPAGKTILSATLTLHHWGNAGDPGAPNEEDRPHDSYAWAYIVSDPWQEMTIHWNNAPLPRENLGMTHVTPLSAFPGWPGVPYQWDVTKAVAEAYAAGQSVSLAIYDSVSARNTSKYLTSSETGLDDPPDYWNWNIEGRPKLTIVWGGMVAGVNKDVWPVAPTTGQRVTYTLSLLGSGQALTLTDNLPTQVSAPGPIQVTGGPAASYDAGAHRLAWQGSPALGQPVTITFPVTVQVSGHLAVPNTAVLTDTTGNVSTDTTLFIVNAYQAWLPLVRR